jgi:tetratricopeptide (TPR) repeat protein
MKKKMAPEPLDFIDQAFPQAKRLLAALEGDPRALSWLEANSPGTALLARLLTGDASALDRMNNGAPGKLDDLFEMVDNDDLARLLKERNLALCHLFAALRGEESAARALKRLSNEYYRHLPGLREAHEKFLRQSGPDPLEESAADMGCLVGEMLLGQGEFEKAIEAFSRAIETAPSADLYEGRARAYRGLAEQDVERAQLMRSRA